MKVERKTDLIYEWMRRSIIRLEIRPGAPIVEKDICARFGASRTPVREAVQKLADEDLVRVFPQSGTFVRHLSLNAAEEGFIIRRALEIEGIRRASGRITDEQLDKLNDNVETMRRMLEAGRQSDYIDQDDAFHAEIANASGLTNLWKFVFQAKVHLDRLRHLTVPVPGHFQRVTDQHEAIVRALATRDADQAELSLRIHLESSFAVMADLKGTESNLFAED